MGDIDDKKLNGTDPNATKTASAPEEDGYDIERYLEEKRKLDAAFEEKFTKVLTIMFTDLKGSTSFAETLGDLGTRMLLKHHDDIVLPILKEFNGTLIKKIGDGTMSQFPTAQDGVRAGVKIQQKLDEFNATKTIKTPILIRIGLHTGKVVVEKNGDVLGDVVNTASRFESSSSAGEVCFSEETYNAMTDKAEMYVRFIRMATLKGKKEPVKVYKAYWNPKEAQADKEAKPVEEVKGLPVSVKFALAVIIPIVIAFIILQVKAVVSKNESAGEKRSISQSVDH